MNQQNSSPVYLMKDLVHKTGLSADTIRFPHLNYIPILDNGAVSPIFITARAMDRSEDLQLLFDCIYHLSILKQLHLWL